MSDKERLTEGILEEETQDEVEARLDRECAETVENLRYQWPYAADWNVLDNDNVQILDAHDNVLAIIAPHEMEGYYSE